MGIHYCRLTAINIIAAVNLEEWIPVSANLYMICSLNPKLYAMFLFTL